MGKIILEWKVRSLRPGWERKQDIANGGGLEPEVNVFEISVKFYCGGAVKKLMLLKRITLGGLGPGPQAPEAMGDFL